MSCRCVQGICGAPIRPNDIHARGLACMTGMAEDLWGFAATSAAAARERDAQLMAEYDACLAASSEIFDKAMWLRLGKVPSRAQGDRPLDRRGGAPTMVQAGQGALLSRLRQQQQQQQASCEQTYDAGNLSERPRCSEKRHAGITDVGSSPAAPRDDSHANIQYEFVMGGGLRCVWRGALDAEPAPWGRAPQAWIRRRTLVRRQASLRPYRLFRRPRRPWSLLARATTTIARSGWAAMRWGGMLGAERPRVVGPGGQGRPGRRGLRMEKWGGMGSDCRVSMGGRR